MRKPVLALLPLVLLIACNKPGGRNAAAPSAESQALHAEVVQTPMAAPARAPMLAYDYRMVVSVPSARIAPLLARHEQACNTAGAGVCQVISSETTTDRGVDTATLKLRAEPRWLAGFRGRLAQEVRGEGGAVTATEASSEDLTRQVVDTEAMLRAKTTLRDRLQQLLASHPGKVSDLLEIEKQLAEVQGEIDAAQSELAAMRGRVDMSTLTLRYEARSQFISAKAARPLGEAVRGFFGVVMVGAAAILYVTAFLIPFALVIVPLVWWLRRRHLRRKAARPPES